MSQLVAEWHQAFWQSWQDGDFLTEATALAHTHRWRGLEWLRDAGGVRPRRGRNLQGRYLSFAEREEIALGQPRKETVRSIAARLDRSPSTISREITRSSDKDGTYRASTAHARAFERAGQPKAAKLAEAPWVLGRPPVGQRMRGERGRVSQR